MTDTTQHPGTPEAHAEGVATVLGETETPLARMQRGLKAARAETRRLQSDLHHVSGVRLHVTVQMCAEAQGLSSGAAAAIADNVVESVEQDIAEAREAMKGARECDICRMPVHEDSKYPLCDKCEKTARAGGRMQAQYERTLREEPEVMD